MNVMQMVGVAMLFCLFLPIIICVISTPEGRRFIVFTGVGFFIATWIYVGVYLIQGGLNGL